MATLVVAISIYGFSNIKTTLKLFKAKNGDVTIEVSHTPHSEDRWLYISGNSPAFTNGSLIQLEGANCSVLHAVVWKHVPQVGILEIRIDIRDSNNKILESLDKQIILGADPESEGK